MMTQQRVETYLDRLEKELSDLPRDRRRELVGEIRGHIDEALALTPDPGEADVRNILERLGDLLTSRIWRLRDKAIGLLLFPGGLFLPSALLLEPGRTCLSSTTNGHTTESCTGYSCPPLLGSRS